MRIGINCGHTVSGQPGCGAVGYLNESNETRNVGRALIRMLKAQGHRVYDCTNDYAASTNANLSAIIDLANAQPLDLLLSIHFNAGGGKGAECWTYGSGDVGGASKIKHALAMLGFKDRGIKDGSDLYVVRRANATTVLIEVCFVDTKSDAELYQSLGAERIAATICKAVTGESADTKKEEELTMAQYDELKSEIRDLTETVKQLAVKVENVSNPMIYNYIDNNMPEWAKPTIQKLVDKGVLKGDEGGLNLTEDLMRILVVNDRAGLYGK